MNTTRTPSRERQIRLPAVQGHHAMVQAHSSGELRTRESHGSARWEVGYPGRHGTRPWFHAFESTYSHVRHISACGTNGLFVRPTIEAFLSTPRENQPCFCFFMAPQTNEERSFIFALNPPPPSRYPAPRSKIQNIVLLHGLITALWIVVPS